MKDKSYWKETFECFLIISLMLVVFFGTIILSGKLSGNDLLGPLLDLPVKPITFEDIKQMLNS